MEVANTLDIDGNQWEIRDTKARDDIATIKQSMTVERMQNIKITLNNGYSAVLASIVDIQKYGKLYMGLLYIDNLSGENIGTNNTAEIGTVNINLKVTAYAVGIEYIKTVPTRFLISPDGHIAVLESAGMTSGNNRIRIPITWIEA